MALFCVIIIIIIIIIIISSSSSSSSSSSIFLACFSMLILAHFFQRCLMDSILPVMSCSLILFYISCRLLEGLYQQFFVIDTFMFHKSFTSHPRPIYFPNLSQTFKIPSGPL